MTTPAFLNWPFFEARHRELHAEVEAWCVQNLDAVPSAARGSAAARDSVDARGSVDEHCIALVRKLGSAGLLRHCVRANHGGAAADFDVRSIALIREALARFDGLGQLGPGSSHYSKRSSPYPDLSLRGAIATRQSDATPARDCHFAIAPRNDGGAGRPLR